MIVKEILARGILSNSKIYDYVVNPYTGCQHACSYCYARFMKRFTGTRNRGVNSLTSRLMQADLLRKEVNRKKKGRVWMSGVCDPYQPLEAKYRLTRKCLEILIGDDWPVTVTDKIPLVLRDIDLLKVAKDIEVGITVTTADDGVRRLFEPNAPSVKSRIHALDELMEQVLAHLP